MFLKIGQIQARLEPDVADCTSLFGVPAPDDFPQESASVSDLDIPQIDDADVHVPCSGMSSNRCAKSTRFHPLAHFNLKGPPLFQNKIFAGHTRDSRTGFL